jgi:hypothetical protein
MLLEGGWIPVEPSTAELPDLPAEHKAGLRLLSLLALVLGIVGTAYLYLAGPASRGLDTGALGRFIAVRDFYLAHPGADADPGLVVVGDSLSIESINCRLLNQLVGSETYSVNLAVPSKVNAEYLLDSAQPVLSDALVVACIGPATTFSASARTLLPRRANMIRLLDYQLDEAAWRAYGQATNSQPEVDYLLAPRWRHAADSRWRIVSQLETSLKLALPGVAARTKSSLRYLRDGYSRDLLAASMPLDFTADELRANLARRAAENPELLGGAGFHPLPQAAASFDFALDALAQHSRGVVLVIAPLHPLVRARLGPEGIAQFKERVEGYAAGNVRILDFSGLLDAGEFGDEVHPNPAGAEAITRELARQLGLASGGATGALP